MQGSKFRQVRESLNKSQQDIAKLFNVALSTVHRWEKLERVPTLAEFALQWIAREYNRPMTREERQIEESRRSMAHVAHMREIEQAANRRIDDHDAQYIHIALHEPDQLTETYLAKLKSKYPWLFNTTE